MSLEENANFVAVRSHVDAMLEFGGGIVDGERSPLMAGVIDPSSRTPITAMSPTPPQIRVCDFNWCGNNLLHDLPFLEALLRLSGLTGDARYRDAVKQMIGFHVAHCPDPETGLFPWGEHAQWSFSDKAALPCSFTDGLKHFLVDRYIIHEHHQFADRWFWDEVWAQSPETLVRYCHGLDHHIVDTRTFEHNRHAPLNGVGWRDRANPDTTGTGKDFARHSAAYIFDCAFGFQKSGDSRLIEWALRKARYHMERRLPTGIIRGCIRSKDFEKEGQHDAFTLGISDAARVLSGRPESRDFQAMADELLSARASHPNVNPLPETGDARLWADGYFRKPIFSLARASLLHDFYQRSQIRAYRDTIMAQARWLDKHLPAPPEGLPVLARRFEFMLDAAISGFVISQDPTDLALAERIAGWARRDLDGGPLLMGCSHMKMVWFKANGEYHIDPWAKPTTPGFYYSCTGTPSLIRGLLRLAVIQETGKDMLGIPSYHR